MGVLLPLLLTLPPSALVMIGTSLAIGVFLVASMFVIAYAFQNPQLVAVAKEELAAFVFTLFIIVFWMSLDTSVNALTLGLLSGALPSEAVLPAEQLQGIQISHLNLALASLDIMDQKLRSQYVDLYLFEALIGFLSTVSFPLGSPVPAVNVVSFSLAPFTGLVLLSNAHTTVVESIGYVITLVWGKEFIMMFARDAIPLLLLPLGIVLRSVPLFRRTGSSIIALAFALYFVFPFAVLLSNYLIFDIYDPPDFAYTPLSINNFASEKSAEDWQADISQGKENSDKILEQFEAPGVVEGTYDSGSACSGNFIVRMLCSVKNVFSAAFDAVAGFIGTVATIWRFMVGMTGDFFFGFKNNPLMPASASAGLYYFIIKEVTTVSPFIILVLFTTVIEIVITITMYRSISLLIGGEAELIGITKIV